MIGAAGVDASAQTELDTLLQNMIAAQYQAVAKVSKATATRHLSDLLEKGCLEKLPGGGRSTRYQINWTF